MLVVAVGLGLAGLRVASVASETSPIFTVLALAVDMVLSLFSLWVLVQRWPSRA